METEVLRNYVEIIDCGSITAAAKKLYIAQPALSLQLKGLEKELGATLLIRSAHKLELTDTGRMLYKKAKSILSVESSIRREAADIANSAGSIVRLCTDPLLTGEICTRLMPEFKRHYPSIGYELYEASYSEAMILLSECTADIALVCSNVRTHSDMTAIKCTDDRIAAVYDKRFFSLDGSGELELQELFGMPAAVPKNCEKLISDAFCRRYDKKRDRQMPMISCTASDISTLFGWAGSGLGISLMPLSAYRSGGRTQTLSARSVNEPSFAVERYILTRQGAAFYSTEKKFYDFLCAAMTH